MNRTWKRLQYLWPMVVCCWGCSPSSEKVAEQAFAELPPTALRQAQSSMPPELRAAYIAARQTEHLDDSAAKYPLGSDSFVAVEQVKLWASDASESDQFGFSVAVSGDTALVGAHRVSDNDLGYPERGTAYVFVRVGSTWIEQQKLLASDGKSLDRFGYSVALDGDTAFVGAYSKATAQYTQHGAVYVFTRNGTQWTERQKLIASDGNGMYGVEHFGGSVALSQDTAIIGAPNDDDRGAESGSAYVFTRNGETWYEIQKLIAIDAATRDYFGTALGLSGDTVLIGAREAAYVFTRSGSTWFEQQKLYAADGASEDLFGWAVALSGDTAVIGAKKHQERGAAYVFKRSGLTWSQQQKLVASDGISFDGFGSSVALEGNAMLVGAPWVGGSGGVYVFARNGLTWGEQQKLVDDNGMANDAFGASVALSGNTMVIGAPEDDDKGKESGSVHVFGIIDGCLSAAECATGFCVDGVCCDSECGGGVVGDCQACSVLRGAAVDGICAPLSAGAICRVAADACDLAEQCDGMAIPCPQDILMPYGTICRPVAGPCDVAESCDGKTTTCPVQSVLPINTVCRPRAGPCDVIERCTGLKVDCPPDILVAAGGKCRAAADVCDASEECNGTSPDCPADEDLPNGASCPEGTCNNGLCNGPPNASGGAGGGGGAGGNAGEGGFSGPIEVSRSCSCRLTGAESSFSGLTMFWGVVMVALLFARRRHGVHVIR